MKSKLLFSIIFMFIFFQLFSISEFACSFLFINTSASNSAFGTEAGTADIRHLSASSINNNPAKLGAFRGISCDYTNIKYGSGRFTSSNLAIGWNGIGFSLPMINGKSEFNTRLDYKSCDFHDEYGTVIDTYKPYETNHKFSVGFDLLRIINKYFTNYQIERYNLYLGYSHSFINSRILPKSISFNGKSSYGEVGLLFEYLPKERINRFIKNELTFGLNMVNPTKSQ
ncbi:MAG TPA: hypothetical protein PLD62_08880, partial [Candidatus Cloacimonadota bacterium]|nr:hypothetical protein [Candidatus Cloacimonadota bacterium]